MKSRIRLSSSFNLIATNLIRTIDKSSNPGHFSRRINEEEKLVIYAGIDQYELIFGKQL